MRRRWPTIWSLPQVPRSTRVAADAVGPGNRVIDIGGSDGRFGKRLPAGAEYTVVDPDPAVQAGFRAAADVPDASADVVTCFETIEHVTLDEGIALMREAARILKPGGRLFVSTPNVHHPWSFLRSATHITPWCYDELGGLVEMCGLNVEKLCRCHRDSFLKGMFRAFLRPLHRAMGVDYAKSVLVVARREQRPEK